jgi:hypothetical protein
MIDEDDCGAVGGKKIGRGNRSTQTAVVSEANAVLSLAGNTRANIFAV